jgi:thioredoxin-dependent peroxiredoxin
MSLLGHPAPDFALPDSEGKTFHLSEALKSGPVLLVFYPGDFTPVCTKQLCSYRDNIDRFSQFGVQVIGISPDPVDKHEKFKREHGFNFSLLADPKREAIRAYGMLSKLGLGELLGMTRRGNFVVDRKGYVVYERVETISLFHGKPADLETALRELRASGRI